MYVIFYYGFGFMISSCISVNFNFCIILLILCSEIFIFNNMSCLNIYYVCYLHMRFLCLFFIFHNLLFLFSPFVLSLHLRYFSYKLHATVYIIEKFIAYISFDYSVPKYFVIVVFISSFIEAERKKIYS